MARRERNRRARWARFFTAMALPLVLVMAVLVGLGRYFARQASHPLAQPAARGPSAGDWVAVGPPVAMPDERMRRVSLTRDGRPLFVPIDTAFGGGGGPAPRVFDLRLAPGRFQPVVPRMAAPGASGHAASLPSEAPGARAEGQREAPGPAR